MTKNEIRAQMKAFLAGLTPEVRHQRSLDACNLLASTREFKHAQMIMLFLSTPTEVETSTLAMKAWSECKSIAVPRVDWEHQKMAPVEINSLDTAVQTSKGVREPVAGRVVPLDLIDMVVVPGLGFDTLGYRVGRGRGFYDRFLAQKDFKGVRCALCFHEQVVGAIPREDHDAPMDLIVSDREIIHCGAARAHPHP